jgi:hypothetical protein
LNSNVNSISITESQDVYISSLNGVRFGSPWKVDTDLLSNWISEDGEIVGVKSFLQVRGENGNWVDTGLQIYSKIGDNNIWYTQDYLKEVNNLKKGLDWHKYYRDNKKMVDSYRNEPYDYEDTYWEKR